MKIFSHHGFNDFVVCVGYKGYLIKEYFANYYLHMSDVTFDLRNNKATFSYVAAEPWNVTIVDTGADTATGGRLKRVRRYIVMVPCMMLSMVATGCSNDKLTED